MNHSKGLWITSIALDPLKRGPLILAMSRKPGNQPKPRARRTDKSADNLRENLLKRKQQARAREQQTTEKK